MKRLKEAFSRQCIRPTIYRALRFLAYAACGVLLLDYFAGDRLTNVRSNGFALCSGLFILSVWFAFLRLGGVNLPKRLHLKRPRHKKRVFSYGDIDDNIDELNTDTDNLEDDEADACIIISGMFDAIACIILSFLN